MATKDQEGISLFWMILFIGLAIFVYWWLTIREDGQDVGEAVRDAFDDAQEKAKDLTERAQARMEEAEERLAQARRQRLDADAQPTNPSPRTPNGNNHATVTDDLTVIDGIGPRYRDVLVQAGIDSFAKLARMTEDALMEILQKASLRRPGGLATWPQQAQLAADGKWDDLENFKKNLRS